MKKIAFIVIISFTLFIVSDTILAKTDTEYDTALKYYNSGKYKEAVRIFKEYVKKKPKPSAYYRIGYALYKLGKYDEANEYFKEAYLIDPTFSPELISSTQKYTEAVPATAEKQPETKPESAPEKQPSAEIQPQKAQEPTVTPEKKSALIERDSW